MAKPATNNALESINNVLRSNLTDYKKIKIGILIYKIREELESKSKLKESDPQSFSQMPEISKEIKTLAKLMANNVEGFYLEDEQSNNFYCKDVFFKSNLFY